MGVTDEIQGVKSAIETSKHGPYTALMEDEKAQLYYHCHLS